MNEKLKELIELPEDSITSKDDEQLVEELKKAELIMPIEVISTEDESFEFKPLKISNPNNQEFIPVFSDEDELVKANVEFEIINITSENLSQIIHEDDGYFGIALNPFSEYSLAIPLNEFLTIFK